MGRGDNGEKIKVSGIMVDNRRSGMMRNARKESIPTAKAMCPTKD